MALRRFQAGDLLPSPMGALGGAEVDIDAS